MIGPAAVCVLCIALIVMILVDLHRRDRFGDRDDWPHR